MRILFVVALLGLLCSCQEEGVKAEPIEASVEKAQGQPLPEELQDPEDCDDKVVEIPEEPEEINLGGGGDAGCTIE